MSKQVCDQSKLIQYRRYLHQNPELSLQEYKTTEQLKHWLRESDIDIIDYNLPTGVIAEIKGGKATSSTPVIALRADIDALPITEQTGFSFASVNEGVSHACGHDTHMTMLLGAAELLKQRQSELAGTIRLIFQPAEESSNGAKWLDERAMGLFDSIDAIFGIHNKPDLPVGSIGVKTTAMMASVDRFEISVHGRGGHAGMPEQVLDPIVIGSQLVQAFQTIVSRSLSSLDNGVVSITKFQAGNTWNVIPETAELEGTVRTFQPEARKHIRDLMKRICEGIAMANGVKIDFIWHASIPAVINTPKFVDVVRRVAEKNGITALDPTPNLAGEDFAYYLGEKQIPGAFIWIGSEGPYQWHHPSYTIDEGCLLVGATLLADLAQEVLASWGENAKNFGI